MLLWYPEKGMRGCVCYTKCMPRSWCCCVADYLCSFRITPFHGNGVTQC